MTAPLPELSWSLSRFPAGPVRRRSRDKVWEDTWGPTVKPASETRSWSDLVALFTRWQHYPRPAHLDVAGKLAVDCWSPALYPADCARRKKAEVVMVTCLVLDFDDGTRIEEAAQVYQDFHHIGHTSWSHTEEHHKFRLILPLAEPVPGPEWYRAWRWVLEDWLKRAPRDDAGAIVGNPDTSCKDSSRLYFLPCLRPGQGDRYAWSNQGYYGYLDLPWQTVAEDAPPSPIAPIRPVMVSSSRAEWAIKKRLNELPAARLDLGHVLDGVINADLVRKVRCPQCGQRSVWWPIRPDRRKTAACNHRNGCGWWGWLFDLALLSGLTVEAQAA